MNGVRRGLRFCEPSAAGCPSCGHAIWMYSSCRTGIACVQVWQGVRVKGLSLPRPHFLSADAWHMILKG